MIDRVTVAAKARELVVATRTKVNPDGEGCVALALREFASTHGPFMLSWWQNGHRVSENALVELAVTHGFAHWTNPRLKPRAGYVDEIRVVDRDGVVVHQEQFAITATDYARDGRLTVGAGIVCDLDPLETYTQMFKASDSATATLLASVLT